MDRGGLIHVSDTIFSFFAAMELIVKLHYQADNPLLSNGLKDRIVTTVQEDEDVLFYWSLVSSNWVEEATQSLFSLIVQHWITIRGFSFASSFVEEYKKAQKKTLEKSKGIRKKLLSELLFPGWLFCQLATSCYNAGKGTSEKETLKSEKEEEMDSSDEDDQHPED